MFGLTGDAGTQRVMPETPDIAGRQYTALAELRYQIRKFLHFSEIAAQAVGLAPHQHQLLLVVRGCAEAADQPTIGYIAERLQVRHHSAVELVTRMEAHGLVCRRNSAHDRRRVIVALTGTGESLLHQLSAHHISEIHRMAPALVAALQEVLASVLDAGTGRCEHS